LITVIVYGANSLTVNLLVQRECLACRHLHGHSGVIKVHLSSDKLERGMVTDFKMLGWFKDFLDNVLDHKFIMDLNDPLIPHEAPDYCKAEYTSGTMELPTLTLDLSNCKHYPEGYWTPDLTWLHHDVPQAVREKYEGMVFVPFVPTSENLSAWLLEIAQAKMAKLGVDVVAVEFWETPKSHCKVEV